MPLDLFAGIPVSNLSAALAWYERLLGAPPAFFPNDHEAVWELAEHRYLYIVERQDGCGHGMLTIFLSNFDERVADIATRTIEPDICETYDNGVRKWIYRDPDGNEIGFGGGPAT